MTRDDLLKAHEDYDANLKDWQFFIRAYEGGRAYKEGNYLLRHPFESEDNYTRRKEISYYYNYCAPVVDVCNAYIMKTPPKRTYGDLSSEVVPPRKPKTLFDAFWWDCDLEGTNFDQFMRDAQRYAAIYGRVSIIVDKPLLKVKTKAEAIEKDVRPYLNMITPENLIDWVYVVLETGRKVLGMVKIKETETQYRVWTRFGWQLWEIVEGDVNAVMIDADFHLLGEIPIVNLYSKKSRTRMIGVSDIQDIADINKNIYYFCSDAKEIIENTAFPMLALPEERAGLEDEGDKVVGAKNVLEFDPAEVNSKPYWLEAPHSSLAEIREWIKQDAEEMVRIAKMGGMRNIEQSKQPWSGIAIEGTENQLFASLVGKATNSEQAELDIFKLYALWEEDVFTGSVEYSKEFAIRDLTISLQNAILAGQSSVNSLTFEKERQKVIVDATISDMEEVQRETIHKEIDDLKDLPTPPVINPGTVGGDDKTGGQGE